MRTSLTCLGLLIVALLVGKHQKTQIAVMERRLTAVNSIELMMTARGGRDEPETNYRKKYQKRSVPPSAREVYQTVVSFLKTGRGVTSGPGAIMENREAFRAIMQLDLAGQQELIRLIARSDDPKFRGDPLYKCEQINVCLGAMADRHPEMALDFLRHHDEKIGRFYSERLEQAAMMNYAILRLCGRNPQAGLDALVEQANPSSESWSADTTAQLLATVAKQEPERVLDTLGKLPADHRQASLRLVFSQVETDEVSTRMLQALRNQFSSDQASLKTALTGICQNMADRGKSWDHMLGWLENLHLTDREKLGAAYVVNNWMSNSSMQGQELAAQVLGFLPASKERNYLVWRAVTAFGDQDDLVARADFLKQQNINHEEMLKLDRDGYLRQ
jgi:hypothetical protein